MRFLQFSKVGLDKLRLGAQLLADSTNVNGDFQIADLSAVEQFAGLNMKGFIELGAAGLSAAKSAIAAGTVPLVASSDVKILAPITGVDKLLCIGMNYFDHCTEQNVPVPKEPLVFNKFPSTLSPPLAPIPLENTAELDFEVELAVIIGQTARHVPKSRALEYIFGYTAAHDVSARDLQLKKNGGQWLLGKSLDGYAPLGPVIVTTDELGDAGNLKLFCRVNGETLQDGNTKELVFNVPALIEYLSKFFTLLPGDVIFTGTPPGVGCFRKPPRFLKDGDIVEIEIEKIGSFSNPIKAVGGEGAAAAGASA